MNIAVCGSFGSSHCNYFVINRPGIDSNPFGNNLQRPKPGRNGSRVGVCQYLIDYIAGIAKQIA